ncbi:MAG: flagellin, partial [Tissierellia bacterium]|nr:flagellin [Tissierellia bacterium]
MRINNNIMAMNANRALGINNTGMAKSLEKLSSGLRINRAGDDAAGLSISEKMRAQIRGLNMASKNAQDGISLIQTAEGALDEAHAILQRMRELAVQAANDTNVEVDRVALQDEINQLAAELTRIAENTEFNTQKLLDGNFSGRKFHIGANERQFVELTIGDMSAEELKVRVEYEVFTDNNVSKIKFDSVSGKFVDVGEEIIADGAKAKIAGYYTDDGKLLLAIDKAIGSGEKVKAGINVSNQEAADSAITIINNAIETVSRQRSELGAMQN